MNTRQINMVGQSLARTALATAISLASASAMANLPDRAKVRLQLDDVISSHPVTEESDFDGRLAISGLIQSNPDPLYLTLEERYDALPPFTHASEDIPEEYIAEATLQEKLIDDAKEIASTAAEFVPHIRTFVRYDDIRHDNNSSDPRQEVDDYQTMLAIVNPTLRYQKEQRKWSLSATYDYERGEYFQDRQSAINDHNLDVNWTRRLDRGDELVITSELEDSHDRLTRDAIQDFNSGREGQDIDYDRYMVNMDYRHGTAQDRTRYNIFYFKELSELEDSLRLGNQYELDRDGIGANFAWQYRPRFALAAETRFSDFDYKLSHRDNKHARMLVGSNLILGRRLHANLMAGYERQTFDESIGDDSHGEFVWRANIDWAMRKKTTLRLSTGKQMFEFAQLNRSLESSRFNVQRWIQAAWSEQWTEKLTTRLSYTDRRDKWVNSAYKDRAHQVVATAIYKLTTNLNIAIDAAYTDESTNFGGGFDRRTFTVRTHYSL